MTAPPSGTITFLFTDIEGSTRRWEHAPAAMRGALTRHDQLLRDAITTHGGYVFKTVGDAFCAAFSSAVDAVAAAIHAQRRLAAESWGETGELRVRFALHTGAVEEREADYFGPPVNRVARLLATGYGSQILLSRATVELVRDGLPEGAALRDLGEHRLKDLTRPERIFQLLASGLRADFPPLKSLDARINNLPAQPTPLIGRERELADALSLLRRNDVRLVTLTGPGGTGKTRLGLQVAAELDEEVAGGVFFVPLAAITDSELVVPTIAQAFALYETPGQPILTTLIDHLRGKRLLLLLDNFEQVTAAAPVVGQMLAACTELKILITSRSPLRVRGERELAIPPLGLPERGPSASPEELLATEAVRLFVERARDVRADFRLTAANAPAVAEICRRLDGLPLAIELAAARTKLLPPPVLLARLERRLPLLTGGARDLPERHQTLRGAIAWSHDLLDATERRLFQRLAAFVGGCTVESAAAVSRGVEGSSSREEEQPLLDSLAALVDESLLRQEEEDDGEPRFRMLETIREFALEELAASGDEDAIRQAHAAHHLALAEAAAGKLQGPDQTTWLDKLEREHDNIRAALDWLLKRGDVEAIFRLGEALWLFWSRRGHAREGRDWLERALRIDNGSEPEERARALVTLGIFTVDVGDHRRATRLFEEALTLFRAIGHQPGVAATLINLGMVASDQGDHTLARVLYEDALDLLRTRGDQPSLLAFALNNLGEVAAAESSFAEARALLDEALAIRQELNDENNVAYSYYRLGIVAAGEGDNTAARRLLERSLATFREVGDKPGAAHALHVLGTIGVRRGDHDTAAVLFRDALTTLHDIGEQQGMAQSLERLACTAGGLEQPERAARWLAAAAAYRAGNDTPVPLSDQAEHNRCLDVVRRALGDRAFDAAWTVGSAVPLEDAVRDALRATGR